MAYFRGHTRTYANRGLYNGLKFESCCHFSQNLFKMPMLTKPQRLLIIRLHLEGQGYKKIKKTLHFTHEIFCSLSAVRKVCKKWEENGTVDDKKKNRRKKFGHSQLHKDYIDMTLRAQPDTTARTMKNEILNIFGIDVSVTTIAKVRSQLGWSQKGTRYCQMIRKQVTSSEVGSGHDQRKRNL